MWLKTGKAFEGKLPLPRFQRVRQELPHPSLPDVEQAVIQSVESIPDIATRCRDKRIAITAGSRGISQIVEILAALVRTLQKYQAAPFIVPAMGSHGGATAQGQVEMLASLGITEATVGAPIESSMEVVEVGRLPTGMPVFLDRLAASADGIVIVNRVKPHTDFAGDVESGLAKMAVLGLGKHRGAALLHSYGTEGLQIWMPQAASVIVRNTPVLFGLASVENAYHEVARVAAVTPEGIGGPEEMALLREAYALMPTFPFREIDVLIVDEMGKNISGVGMDPNVIGRTKVHAVADVVTCDIRTIAVLNLTPEAHGNASGIGLADVTTRHLVEQIDFEATYLNCITAGMSGIQRAAIPMVAPDDQAAVETALHVCGQPDPLQARIIRIKNTLSLGEMDISESLAQLPDPVRPLRPVGPSFPLAFTHDGRIVPFQAALPAAGEAVGAAG
jgi:hypothetical protein